MRLSIWNSGRKSNDFNYIDRCIEEFFGIGGVGIFAHLYIGPYLQANTSMITTGGAIVPPYDPTNPSVVAAGVTTIQDPLLLENRDRKYAKNAIELRGIYTLNDLDFSMAQFGLFLQNDTLYIEFPLASMIAKCGRKLIPGDVLELPHRRDTGLDPNEQVAGNKFYLIEDGSRASDGYSATWYPHIWRVKVSPLPASQEYADILNLPLLNPQGLPIQTASSQPPTVGSLFSTLGTELAINQAIDTQAKLDVDRRYLETQQFWMVTPETGADYPWIFAGDGIPPNGAVLLGSGTAFPTAPAVGAYYLRTDYTPQTLFMWTGTAWMIQEQNYRPNWSATHSELLGFINNDNVTTNQDGTITPEKVSLSRVAIPRADF